MKIAYVYPYDDLAIDGWIRHTRHEVVAKEELWDAGVDVVYCGSVTQIQRAWRVKMEMMGVHGRNVPVVCWVWDLPFGWRGWCRTEEEFDTNLMRDADIMMKLNLLWHCDGVIAASEATAAALRAHGIRSEVLYNYIDTETMDSVPEQEKGNWVIQISRYVLNKRFDLTLKVFAELQDKFPSWGLIFHGYGKEEKGAFERLAVELGVKNFICNEGAPRFTVIKDLKRSRVLVSPSVHEGFGLTPLEAHYCGVRTVCSDIPTTLEFKYGDHVFKADDAAGYRTALNAAMRDGTPVPKSGDCYNVHRFVSQFDDLIVQLAKGESL